MKILVLSDVHANLPALEAVLSNAPAHDAIWNLGDTVGYGASPNECLDLLTDAGAEPMLVGNHDLAAVGLLPIRWLNAFAATAAGWTSLQLSDTNRFRIRAGFTSETIGQSYLVHGGPRDPAREYVQTLQDARDSLGSVPATYVFCGHTHVPMLCLQEPGRAGTLANIEPGVAFEVVHGRALVNPGSVGQPRDGDPRAAALIFDTNSSKLTWLRTPYDIERAQRDILAAGLPKELANRLSRGR